MNKRLLLKHIQGRTDYEESMEVFRWIEKSPDNYAYYEKLVHQLSALTFSDTCEYVGKEELEEKLRKVKGTGNNERIRRERRKPAKVFRYFPYAAVFLLFVSLAANFMQYNQRSRDMSAFRKALNVTESDKYYYTENGVKGGVVLPDGTSVVLNSGSRLVYPEHFDLESRNVELVGEAYFDVVKDEDWPMIVTTSKGMKVEVRGTRFHIKSYENDDYEQTTLFSGKISVTKSDPVSGEVVFSRELKPMESVNIPDSSIDEISFMEMADTARTVAWKRGELIFEKTPMDEAVKMLERWHGCHIEVSDTSLYSLRLNAYFTSESMIQIMELLKFSTPIDYEQKDQNTYVIYGLGR